MGINVKLKGWKFWEIRGIDWEDLEAIYKTGKKWGIQ